MELNSTDYKELSNIVSDKLKNPSKELEARLIVSKNNGIGVKDGLIVNHNKFFKIVNFLRQDKKYGGLGLNMTNIISLDIIHNIRTNKNGESQKKNIRYEFYDRDLIKEIWINEDDTLLKILNEEDKKQIDNNKYKISIKERLNNYDIDSYNIRVSLSDEIIVNDKNMLKDINTLNTNRQKSYRYKNRYSFITEDGNFRYDLTMAKNSSGRSLKTSNVLNSIPTFEVEVEYIGTNNDYKVDDLMKQILIYSSNLLQIYQGSNTIVNTKEVKQVMINFSKYSSSNIGYRYNTNSNKNRRIKRLTVNPVTMQQNHLSMISKDYALTYKADGERYLIYVDDLSSEVYLIHEKSNTLLKVGVKLPKWNGTIVEGEYISYENTILCYDVLFSKGNDIRKKDLKERYEQAKELSEDYQKEVENISNEVINISLKEYIFSEGKKIYKESKHLWNARNSKFYNVDGLIYTPSNKGYNDMKNKLYKWKPVSLNSIDFLIKTIKDPTTGQDITRSDLLDNGDQIQYKEVKLMVGGKVRGQKNIKAVDFKPKVGYYEGINIAKIILNNNGNMIASDPLSGEIEEIMDDTIVEFIYDKDSDYPWKPIRVRWDKTENYKTAPEGRKNYGNFESIANDNWKSIVKNISEEDLFTGEIQERNNTNIVEDVKDDEVEDKEQKKEINKERRPSVTFKDIVEVKEFNNINPPIDVNISQQSDVYYKNTGSSKDRSITQKFHNQIKSDLYTNIRKLSTGGKLLEIGSGRAGDIHKWRGNKYNEVVGIEYSSENIKHAEKRLSAMKKNRKLAKTLGKITFIHGDFNEPIYPDYNFALSEANKLKAEQELIAKYSFDVVSCQFALHYFFKTKDTVRQMIENVSDSLKKGGYFIGTVFDGKRVFDSLKKTEKIEGINFEGEVEWSISKDYNEKKFLISKPNYGMAIDVFIESIGTTNKEYLVNLKYFIKIMKKNGFSLVEMKSFSDVYDDYLKLAEDEQEQDEYGKYSSLKLDEMLPYDKTFSFFYNYFIFKKVKDVKTIVA